MLTNNLLEDKGCTTFHAVGTAADLRFLDRETTGQFGIPLKTLVAEAGRRVALEAEKMLVGKPQGVVLVLVGKGNNAADGLIASARLSEKGYLVRCQLLYPEEELNEAATDALAEARRAQVEVHHNPVEHRIAGHLMDTDLVIDAVFGTGLSKSVCDETAELFQKINQSGAPILSVDIPSGLNADTGEAMGCAVKANQVVTFGLVKQGLVLGEGPNYAPSWVLYDDFFPQELLLPKTLMWMESACYVAGHFKTRLRTSHKAQNGHVLIVAGSDLMPGAARLAVLGALRAGAGYVTIAGTQKVCDLVAQAVPEALHYPLTSKGGVISPTDDEIAGLMNSRYTSAVFGPGLQFSDQVHDAFEKIWSVWDKPCCIDASCLDLVAQGLALPKADVILTPHPGEAGRILAKTGEWVQANRLEAVVALRDRLKATVLLKGSFTLVAPADATKAIRVNRTGNPGMASAGMGDVLSGIVGATGDADLAAAWHGLAGDLCAKEIGAIGYTASDLITRLPRARDTLVLCSEQTG